MKRKPEHDTPDNRRRAHAKAAEIWTTLNKTERNLVRLGMFPADKMDAARAEGLAGNLLAVALMECAKK